MEREAVTERFAKLAGLPDEQIELAPAALMIATVEDPHLDANEHISSLDSLADVARRRLNGERDPLYCINALSEFLFDEIGFRGNREDYYDTRNSLLNAVLSRRLGIPITLSLIYIEVGKRLGIRLLGIGMPGHFLVRHANLTDMFVDPFHGGIILSVEECAQRLRQVTGADVRWSPGYLSPISNLEFIARMLRNIKAIYWRGQDYNRALRATNWLMALQPAATQERRDRGLLYAQTGRHALALNDLEEYISSSPSTHDVTQAHELIRQLKRSVSN